MPQKNDSLKATRNYGLRRLIYRVVSNWLSRTCLISSHNRARIFRRLGVDIAENVFIGQNVYIDELAPERIHIGKKCTIARGGGVDTF